MPKIYQETYLKGAKRAHLIKTILAWQDESENIQEPTSEAVDHSQLHSDIQEILEQWAIKRTGTIINNMAPGPAEPLSVISDNIIELMDNE